MACYLLGTKQLPKINDNVLLTGLPRNGIYSGVLNSSDAGDGIFRLLEINTMPTDALTSEVTSASPGMLLTVWDRQYVLLLQSWFHLLGSNQIQDMIQNVNIYLIIFKTIQHVKS